MFFFTSPNAPYVSLFSKCPVWLPMGGKVDDRQIYLLRISHTIEKKMEWIDHINNQIAHIIALSGIDEERSRK